MSKPVILDSSALIAQINLADSLHEKVQAVDEFIAEANRQVILPYEVFAEAINIFICGSNKHLRQESRQERGSTCGKGAPCSPCEWES